MAQVEIIAANLKNNIKNSVKRIIKKVCAYARVSTDSEEQLTSYSSQINHYTNYIKSNSDWEFAGVYADEGISGTQVKKRTEFMRMIDDALNGKIDMIIAKSISRFARNTLDTLKYVRLLREHNVDVYFEKENIHTLELDSEMFLTLYSAFAQAESESTSQNVKMGMRAKMKRGEMNGIARIYGYIWNKETKELEINEEQAKIVRQVFNWYINGKGTQTISRLLNEKGILTYTGKRWTSSRIRNMIINEKYVGDLISQKWYIENPISHRAVQNFGEKEKYYVKDHHIPVISREVWNKAQEIYEKRSSKVIPEGSKHPTNYSKRYPFSSKITCGFCGTTYVRRHGSKKKDGTIPYYWMCYQRVYDKKDCKDSRYIREDILEKMFIELYNNIVKNKHKTKELLLNTIKNVINDNDYQKSINEIENNKKILQDKLLKLVDMRLDNSITKEVYDLKETEIKTKLSNLDEELKELQKLNDDNKNISTKIKEIEKIINVPCTLTEFDENTFENFVEKIVVGEVLQNGEKDPNVIRFILKTGSEFKITLTPQDVKTQNVSFGSQQRTI